MSTLFQNTAALVALPAVLVFFALMLSVGFLCRRHAVGLNQFVLGGRNVGPWLTAFAFGTSYFSAVIFVGYAGQFGWNFGLASTWIGLGNALIGSLLAWKLLGRRTRLMTNAIGSRTMPDFFEKRYESRGLKIAASAIIFVFLIPYTASLYNGLSGLFHGVFDIPYPIIVCVMAALTGLYVIFGGYMATAINDFIQGMVMLFGIVAVVIAVLSQNGGLAAAANGLSLIPDVDGRTGAYASLFGPQPFYLLIVVLLTSLGTWGLPQMVGKFYSIRDEDSVRKGTVISTFFALTVAGGCYFLGGFGRLYDRPEFYGANGALLSDRIVPTMVRSLPTALVALVIVLVLSASMSTLSSLALTSSSTLALDVILPLRRKRKAGPQEGVGVIRVLIVFFVAVSAVIAILKDTVFSESVFIAQMMGVSWGALAGSFLGPFLWGLTCRFISRPAVAASFIFGTGSQVLQLLKNLGVFHPTGAVAELFFRNSLYSGVFAMLFSLLIVPVVSLLTPRHCPVHTEQIFALAGLRAFGPRPRRGGNAETVSDSDQSALSPHQS